jgi:predicted tellurium resistance membrane protein TerC
MDVIAAAATRFLEILWLNVVLSGDNAVVIGLAAAGLAPRLRRQAVLFGILAAAVLRILFSVFATYLRPCCMNNSVQQQGLTLYSRPIFCFFCSNSANFGNFSATANESHFDETSRRLNSLVYSSVSFPDPCNKVLRV